jgi:gas vesicle protein
VHRLANAVSLVPASIYAEYTETELRLTALHGAAVELIGGVMDKNGLSSFLLGLGVGVGLGMLFAPKSGQETRDIIKKKTGEAADEVQRRSNELKQTASEWVDKGREALGRQRDNISDAMEAGRQAYRDTVGRPPQSETPAQ